jgi:hypothetical protein
MSLMLVADVVVAHARSTAAESCPAGESCMLLLNTLSLLLTLQLRLRSQALRRSKHSLATNQECCHC